MELLLYYFSIYLLALVFASPIEPDISAEAAILIEIDSGEILYEKMLMLQCIQHQLQK